ncbi:SWIM zinc finger family protein [Sporolactobacillus sp. Y61]|uniref:SWIM zinc finger family protein n=1 Tax=Sporolactobacillus sp. Y61 TaxID=3160863 RepID=A0AAU8ICN9_9BACL|nr:SWIM zinc finger family protein [Sporolactobacillus sp. THM19-2]RYL93563.1 hypothetical protein EWH91_03695 [Sporolactobacillus sp. THM19-2]
MKGLISIHDPQLADWLIHFSGTIDRTKFSRGYDFCRRNRVWDYHASQTSIHANVEDRHSEFCQVDIRWDAARSDPAGPLPRYMDKRTFHCSCGGELPCEHIAAVIIYRISELDKSKKVQKISAVLPVNDDFEYQRMLSVFGKQIKKQTPAFTRFDPSKLRIRPDFQKEACRLIETAMKSMREDP